MANYYPNYPNYQNYYPQYNNGYQQNQSYANQNFKSMEWVEGEVGAKAFQMPAGWPINTPIVLWDSTEKKIFLKSWNQMGAANPMQELDYEMKEQPNPLLVEGLSGHDMSQYVTKHDFDELKEEIKKLNEMMANNQSGRSRGGQA